VCCLLFLSCERDDICPPSTPTTPLLVIEFFDVTESDENKAVQGLSYIPEGTTDTIFLGSTDSIAIPLNTNKNRISYQFIRNTNNANFINSDVVEFIYQVDEVFVNRACGFKAVYSNLSAIRAVENPPANNWIRSVIREQTDVENEQNTHISILH
jgi:hypothetical protein